MKNKLTDLCGNRLLQNNFINNFGEMRSWGHLEGCHGVHSGVDLRDVVSGQVQVRNLPDQQCDLAPGLTPDLAPDKQSDLASVVDPG